MEDYSLGVYVAAERQRSWLIRIPQQDYNVEAGEIISVNWGGRSCVGGGTNEAGPDD